MNTPDPLAARGWLAEAGWVFAMHSAQLWADPTKAGTRLTALWVEKQNAFTEGAVEASLAVLRGATPNAIVEAAMGPTRRCVRTNAMKLRLA